MANSTFLAFEFLERAIRLYSHIQKSCVIAFIPGARPTVQINIAKDVQKSLMEVIISSIEHLNSSETPEEKNRLEFFHTRLEYLSSIHIYGLTRVPRPHEPIELVSYLRQATTHFNSSNAVPVNDLQIFATESLGNQAHFRFRLKAAQLKLSLPEIIAGDLVEFATNQLSSSDNDLDDGERPLVSLPRIDLGNPCRWPSLMHEVGHTHHNPEFTLKNFESKLTPQQFGLILEAIRPHARTESDESARTEITNWLRECWCDAFAVITAGPAAFFAQLHAFIFSFPCYLTQSTSRGMGYPPAWFRLKLLLILSEARLDDEDPETKYMICKAMEEEKKLVYELFDIDVTYDAGLALILNYFKDFLRMAFPRNQYSSNTEISSGTLRKLVEDLSNGLPIPSIADRKQNNSQRATSSSEVLLAGWIHRCTTFKSHFLRTISQADHGGAKSKFAELISFVDRSDETLKRSIQMAEWFQILIDQVPQDHASDSQDLDGEDSAKVVLDLPGPLSDRDINKLLITESLRIIPLIDANLQVRGSVIDLRLGHNFEVFFANVPHVIDPFKNSLDDEADSMEVDVDFSHGIDIGPGQFILAHTLEYIKLPNNVAAQIEGRSSFARLGLQVHMTANLVEAGFDGCLTLEIMNNGPSTIKLYPGMRIAQLRFFRLVTEPKYPYGKSGENKYRGKLSHNKTKQFSDWEVSAIEKAKIRFGISENPLEKKMGNK